MAVTSTIMYCTERDIQDVYPNISAFDLKRRILGWKVLSTDKYIADNTGLITQLFMNSQDLGVAQSSAGDVNSNYKWYYLAEDDRVYFFSDTTNPAHNQLQMWATPEVTLGQQFQNLGRYFTEGWTPGGALAVGTAAATSPVWGPSAMKGAQWVGSKIPGMSTLASRYAKTGPVGAVGAGIAASQLAGQAGHAIGGEVGEQTAEAIASGGITAGLGALQKYVNTHGYSKLMKLVVKKKGKSFAMKTLGKLGLGLIGGGATGGIATAAMAAWTAKDLYEVVQLISSETSK